MFLSAVIYMYSFLTVCLVALSSLQSLFVQMYWGFWLICFVVAES